MSDEIKAAVINARCATALIRAMGMQAENQLRLHRNEVPAYDNKSFDDVIVEEGVSWNQISTYIFQ